MTTANQTTAKGKPTSHVCGADKKYEITSVGKMIDGHIVRQIRALRDFYTLNAYIGMHTEELCFESLPILVQKGTLGGWIESYDNLENVITGNYSCWVAGDACVYGSAKVTDAGLVCHNAQVYDDVKVSDYGIVGGYAKVFGRVRIEDHATVGGNAVVCNRKTMTEIIVSEFASIGGFARVQVGNIRGNARIDGRANLFGSNEININGHARISDKATLCSDNGAICVADGVYIGGNAKVHGGSSLYDNSRLM